MKYDLSDIDMLVNDRQKFNKFIYTPLAVAVKELDKRSKSKELDGLVTNLLNGDIPEPLRDGLPKGILFRSLLSPNYEVARFINIMDSIKNLKPVFFEYTDDKFTSNNILKHSLGKMGFYFGRNKNNDSIIKFVSITDFNKYNGKKISEIKTLWGESFVAFHHSLFKKKYTKVGDDFYHNISPWFLRHGPGPKDYYKSLMLLCCKGTVFFENFMIDNEDEKLFTKEVVLPAFMAAYEATGVYPLVVALEPTSIEGDSFWSYYPHEYLDVVEGCKKLCFDVKK